jgi:hypothetical protein
MPDEQKEPITVAQLLLFKEEFAKLEEALRETDTQVYMHSLAQVAPLIQALVERMGGVETVARCVETLEKIKK